MHQVPTLAAREKLVEMGYITRLRSTFRRWYCQNLQQWQTTPDHSYFVINRMRSLQSWPQQDPSQRLFEINYHQYKAMWDHMCLWSDRYIYYYYMMKFSSNFRNNTNPEPEWLEAWWKKFGLNSSAIHLDVIETWQFIHQVNLSDNVHRLGQISNTGFMNMFIDEKHPWVIRIKYVLQQEEDSNENPNMYREVFKQHWDPYRFNHFHDQPVK